MVETVVVSGSVTGLVWEHLGKIMGNTNRHSLIMLVAALFVFYIFKNIKIKNSNIVGWIAGNVFGIYLFHENIVFLMSEKITFAIDKIGWSSKLFVVEYILIALCIFGAGLLFEAIRNSCIQKPFTIWINKKYPQQLKKVSSWFNEY